MTSPEMMAALERAQICAGQDLRPDRLTRLRDYAALSALYAALRDLTSDEWWMARPYVVSARVGAQIVRERLDGKPDSAEARSGYVRRPDGKSVKP